MNAILYALDTERTIYHERDRGIICIPQIDQTKACFSTLCINVSYSFNLLFNSGVQVIRQDPAYFFRSCLQCFIYTNNININAQFIPPLSSSFPSFTMIPSVPSAGVIPEESISVPKSQIISDPILSTSPPAALSVINPWKLSVKIWWEAYSQICRKYQSSYKYIPTSHTSKESILQSNWHMI